MLQDGAIMRLTLTVAVLCCTAIGAASAQDIVPPEVVRLKNVRIDGEPSVNSPSSNRGKGITFGV